MAQTILSIRDLQVKYGGIEAVKGISFDVEEGGYIHENGEYTRETSLILSLIDTDRKTVNEIAKDLCVFFHQESVMITEDHIRTYFISETLE